MNILGSPPPGKTPTVSFRARRGCEGRGGGRRRHKDVISVAIKTTGQEPHNLRSGDFFFFGVKKRKPDGGLGATHQVPHIQVLFIPN